MTNNPHFGLIFAVTFLIAANLPVDVVTGSFFFNQNMLKIGAGFDLSANDEIDGVGARSVLSAPGFFGESGVSVRLAKNIMFVSTGSKDHLSENVMSAFSDKAVHFSAAILRLRL